MKKHVLGLANTLNQKAARALSYSLKIPEADLQASATKLFPIEYRRFLVTAKLVEPRISLDDYRQEIRLSTQLKVLFPGGLCLGGKVAFSGSVRYERKTGAFFFDNLRVINLDIDFVSRKKLLVTKDILQMIAKKLLAKHPIYVLGTDTVEEKLARVTLKTIRVADNMLCIELGLLDS